MRWFLRIGFPFALLWAAYQVSPFVAFYRLVGAVQARDVDAVNARVDFPALRQSVARQIAAEYLARTNPGETGLRRQTAVGVGATVIDAILERFVTAESLIGLLGSAQGREPASGGPAPPSLPLAHLDVTLEAAWRLWAESQPWGFRQVTIYVAPPKQPDERLGFRMQLEGPSLAWRLIGLDLPPSVRERLVNEVGPRAG